ncbi:MAG TPA: hypothetical protein VEL75_14745 [Candidatus Methylomirabilis sp.]|nr:hypothetical protein [Candidatus Methylomirabilis sp.]
MGMDPVQPVEVYEVTVQLEGPVGAGAFDDFEKAIHKFVHDARKITDPDHLNSGGQPKKLKVRVTRTATRSTGP